MPQSLYLVLAGLETLCSTKFRLKASNYSVVSPFILRSAFAYGLVPVSRMSVVLRMSLFSWFVLGPVCRKELTTSISLERSKPIYRVTTSESYCGSRPFCWDPQKFYTRLSCHHRTQNRELLHHIKTVNPRGLLADFPSKNTTSPTALCALENVSFQGHAAREVQKSGETVTL